MAQRQEVGNSNRGYDIRAQIDDGLSLDPVTVSEEVQYPEARQSAAPGPNKVRRPEKHLNPWFGFVLRRLTGLIGVVVSLLVVVFFLVHLIPGDPVIQALGPDTSPSDIERIRQEQGLNNPLVVQFGAYVADLLRGDFGTPFGSTTPVSELIAQRFFQSLSLAFAALFIVLVGSLVIGLVAAQLTNDGKHPRLEVAFTGVTSFFGALPDYLTATLLAFIFAVQLRWLPAAGSDGLESLILPAIALAFASMMNLARIVRVETLNVLAQDYVTAARSQRLPQHTIYLRHVLPNVLTAALTVGGIIFANIMGGAIIVEVVFARPGLGTALVTAVTSHQYVVVQGLVLVLGIIVVSVNAVVDVIVAAVDTRSLAGNS